MKTYDLQIELDLTARTLTARWFGESLTRAEGEQTWPLAAGAAADAAAAAAPNPFEIDLEPLLAEINRGQIDSLTLFQAADDFLPLRDLLAPADFAELCETLFYFLWRASQAESGGLEKTPVFRTPWSDPDRRLLRVWFATNRVPELQEGRSDGPVRGFVTNQTADALTYGMCNVFIPQSHKPGSVGTPWWRRWIRLEADDSLQVRSTLAMSPEDFWRGFADKMQTWWEPGQRNAFVLIHGYNVTFEEAAIRAAQIGYDLKLPGEMAFFSWPSRGGTLDYTRDESTITASIAAIAQFLRELSQRSGAERIHIFAHSMGNRGFLSALERLVADGHPQVKLGQVFFCAPDEDVRTFTDKVTRYPHLPEQRTLLVSPEDRAVALSRWLHGFARVGVLPPVTVVEGIDTIEVRGFGILDLGHGYFASAAPVVEDMRAAIEGRQRASGRTIPQPVENYFRIDVRKANLP